MLFKLDGIVNGRQTYITRNENVKSNMSSATKNLVTISFMTVFESLLKTAKIRAIMPSTAHSLLIKISFKIIFTTIHKLPKTN